MTTKTTKITPEQAAKNRAATNAARAAVKLVGEQTFSSGSSGHMLRALTTVNGRQAWVTTSIIYKDSIVKKAPAKAVAKKTTARTPKA